jgi:uncharacterized membrane protein HdeD (DUF308 family)
MKKMKWGAVLGAVLLIAAGILLVVYPETSASIVCNILGIGLIIYGAVEVILYFSLDIREFLQRDDFVIGMAALLTGCLILFKKDLIMDLIPVIFGLVIFMSGLAKIQNAIVARKIHYEAGLSYLLLGVICVVLGAVVMFALSGQTAAKTLFTIIGIFMIFAGASDLYVTIFLSGKYRKYMKNFEDRLKGNVIDAETSNEREAGESEKKEEDKK